MLPPITLSLAPLAVDPRALAVAGRPLADLTDTLRPAFASLDAAWRAAAFALHRQRTGTALQAGSGVLQRSLASCAQELQGVGDALRASSRVYGDADDRAAIPVVPFSLVDAIH